MLFGVHQFLWHPITVTLAWRWLYGAWPKWHELVAIAYHDVGYIGCANMDDDEGQLHPIAGAEVAANTVSRIATAVAFLRSPIRFLLDGEYQAVTSLRVYMQTKETRELCLGHSRFFSKRMGTPVSKLFLADKACIFFDPAWFYLLRASLSGELPEYLENCRRSTFIAMTPMQWFKWYRDKVRNMVHQHVNTELEKL